MSDYWIDLDKKRPQLGRCMTLTALHNCINFIAPIQTHIFRYCFNAFMISTKQILHHLMFSSTAPNGESLNA